MINTTAAGTMMAISVPVDIRSSTGMVMGP